MTPKIAAPEKGMGTQAQKPNPVNNAWKKGKAVLDGPRIFRSEPICPVTTADIVAVDVKPDAVS